MMGSGADSVKGVSSKDAAKTEYFQIPVNFYQPDEIIDKDLYLYYQGQYLLFRPKNLVWKSEDADRLIQFHVAHLYVEAGSREEHYQFLENNLHRILEQTRITKAEKTQILYETSQSVVAEIFERPQSSESVKRSVSLVKNSIDFLRDKENFHQLMQMASTNFTEYTHAIQTAAYAVALARQVGLTSFNDLSAVGIGSILHDLGKVKVERSILEKAGNLEEEERREVERHPEYGYEILRKTRAVPELAELVVLQHHERPNGTGYPYRLGQEISICARIVAIADCFDSLTSTRPYKDRITPFQAIQMMRGELAKEYDQKLLTEFIKVLGLK